LYIKIRFATCTAMVVTNEISETNDNPRGVVERIQRHSCISESRCNLQIKSVLLV
jgi:hypothetical protein